MQWDNHLTWPAGYTVFDAPQDMVCPPRSNLDGNHITIDLKKKVHTDEVRNFVVYKLYFEMPAGLHLGGKKTTTTNKKIHTPNVRWGEYAV